MVRKAADGRVLMLALMWVERRYVISTMYSSLDGAPYIREQSNDGYLKIKVTVRQLQVCEKCHSTCAHVDADSMN